MSKVFFFYQKKIISQKTNYLKTFQTCACAVGCVKNQFFCQINFPKLVMCGNMCQDVPHFFLGFLSKNSVSASHYKIWSLLTNIWCFRVNIPHRTAAWITKFFQQKVIAAPIESNFFSCEAAALYLIISLTHWLTHWLTHSPLRFYLPI